MRRKEIAEAIDLIEQALEILDAVIEEEQEAFDNMPEGIQNSERGEVMGDGLSILNDFMDSIDTDELQMLVDG